MTVFTDFGSLRSRVQAEMLGRAAEHIDRLGWSAEQIAKRQLERLRALLECACECSPFHARRLRGIDPGRFELADLARLPIMTKTQLMDEFDAVLCDRRLDRRLVEQALAQTTSEPCPLFDEYVCLASGGSSGRRGVFVLDSEAATEFFCSLNRASLKRMLERSGGPRASTTTAMVAAGSAVHATGGVAAWTAGFPICIEAVPVTLPLAEIIARLEALQPEVLYGYPSALALLARERQAGRLRIAPELVTTSSETLLPEWRAAIRESFGVPIVDTFGSTEGLVGVSAPDDPVLCFNSDMCIVELVDDLGRPVPPGVPSAKILLTNLANRVQPLIRYEISDRFVRVPDAPEHGHLRATVEGRSDDILRWGSTEVHPLVIRSVLLRTAEEYQVRQTGSGIEVDLVAADALDLAPVQDALERALAAAGLSRPRVVARKVRRIERHPETGKVRRFIPA